MDDVKRFTQQDLDTAIEKARYIGMLYGARELCIYCANNHPVENDGDFIPSYIHRFSDSERLYVCAASRIWQAGGYQFDK